MPTQNIDVKTVTTPPNGKVSSLVDLQQLVADSTVPLAPATQDDDQDVPEEMSALDVTPVKGLQLGWIDQYADLNSELTASPPEFHQLAGLVTAATAIQRKAFLPMSFGNIYTNIYACIVAMSTVYGKSTAINRPRQVLQAAMMEKLLIPAHGSSEGLIKQLSITPSALMVRDEIGTLFGLSLIHI